MATSAVTTVQPHDTTAAMEDIHGVDVSWLHHSTRDHHHRQQAPSSPGLTRDAPPKTSSHGGLPTRGPEERKTHSRGPSDVAKAAPAAPAQKAVAQPPPEPATPPQKMPKRPALLGRSSAEKVGGTTPPDSKSPSRRNSWINSLSSKFGSQNPPAQTTHAQAQGSPAPSHATNGTTSSANGALNGIQAASAGGQNGLEPYIPQQPKASFLSNALRRLSSGTQVGTVGKVHPNGGMCPRKVMNVDPNRDRCLVPELDQNKLRKVAFCVDVEIAGGPKYKDDADSEERKKKRRDKKLKERGEGEALKHPDAVADEKDKDGIVAVAQESLGDDSDPNPEGTVLTEDKKETNNKKEKKKRSEAERKERKEKKRRKAEENGSIPIEFTRDDDQGSVEGVPVAAAATITPPRSQDRPTVDPLRIYRRCCQLRESPILKRISDQLSAPSACSLAHPGVVTCLDLTGSRLQLADVMTLSDWLAIVPVKKLFLEDADLNDEKIRVILAGLLAAKMPDAPRRRAPTQEKNGSIQSEEPLQGCAIKKLVLKNNPKITAEGWKHIALFIYMCKSVVALDVSMIPFPRQRSQIASPPNTPQEEHEASRSRPSDVADIFSKAIAERLGGSELQELSMGECSLTSSNIRKVIDGCTMSGIQRLGLASNDIDSEGLEHVMHYIRSGVCRGIDLGGNDLGAWIPRLCEGLGKHNPTWALCLQDTGLTPEGLKILFPTLVAMPNLRFLDLSHNKGLFSHQSSVYLIRKYLPLLKELKRIHLTDVDLKPADAIAIAEIIPDCQQIAHINILENPEISRVATTTDEETQEEAAALYASLTLASKLSTSIICIDVDVPAPEMGEVVKALAKQVVAYCLRNIETLNEVPELNSASKQVEVPHILMHLIGQEDIYCKEENVLPAPDEDYIVGGTGIAKALSYCLSHKATDLQRVSLPASGANTPRSRTGDVEEHGKARAMSKNLLETARNTRARIQPALIREVKNNNEMGYRKLLFLDQTLQGMIQRFEDEYPETRLQPSDNASVASSIGTSGSIPSSSPPVSHVPTLDNSVSTDFTNQDSDEEGSLTLRSRHNSDVSLASRHMSLEEGRLHRFGHRVRTGLLNPSRPTSSHENAEHTNPAFLSGSMDDCGLPEHILSLRTYFQNYSGDEMKQMIEGVGWEKAFDKVVANAEELRDLEKEDPTAFQMFKESQIAALKNRNPDVYGPGEAHEHRKSGDDFAVED
ncbi:RNI-like protein [Ophiobolus disseminans]|uniref:RNI-like protein n=1 Tax=Ophiobolus disseminans TaxID=1469910 RepID=A0A6A6ZLZ2_9PLEO|nr:RNI-like protein [Ophiobolus disseminans]